MIINISFFLFLLCSALLYWIIPIQKIRIVFLSIVSLIFIGYYDRDAAVLVVLLTLYSYYFAYLITAKYKKTFYHRMAVVGLVLVLIIFKYLGLLTRTFDSLATFIGDFPKINFENLLPLGISYIIFKLISYLTDVYWGVTGKGMFLNLLCYSSLFTIYTAGPIERFERFEPQISGKKKFQSGYVETAIGRIIYGLFKKLVIADWIGYLTASIWERQESFSIGFRILALLGYSIQIYTDFAGYSDIAIGSSQLFGIKIMENFDNPYFQRNISEFWRHWHISLSEWIRDYIFFPLSSLSTKKIWSLFLVPIIAMALCGMWHGAAWHFMIWGIWHGLGISIFQTWRYYRRKKGIGKHKGGTLLNATCTLFTFVYVTIGWLWFR
jgi:D-alanyl-lipoteichoic acid acyltransferase DltB (MBOAT superfamily)